MSTEDWETLRRWARCCGPNDVAENNSLQSGIMILAVAAAVGRTLDEEALWSSVAEACSPHLRGQWFGGGDYPQGPCRKALEDACLELGVRQQLHLRGKHHYWRTVMLQFGFSAMSAARSLPLWLYGYNVPETVNTLLGEDENGSRDFQSMWETLHRWADKPEDAVLEAQLERNHWYPRQSHALLKGGLLRDRPRPIAGSRVEDEEPEPTIFDVPRLSNEHFSLRLARSLPPDFKHIRKPVTMSAGGRTFLLLPNEERGLRLEDESIVFPAYDILAQPSQEVKLFLPGGKPYRERFAFWDEASDVVFFVGAQGRRKEVGPKPGETTPCSLVVRGEISVHTGAELMTAQLSSPDWSLYVFPHGLPAGLEVCDQAGVVWPIEGARTSSVSTSLRGQLEIREDSPLHLDLRVLPPSGWQCSRFRFAGRTFAGPQAAIAATPGLAERHRTAFARVHRGAESIEVPLQPYVRGAHATGAAYQDSAGQWHIMESNAKAAMTTLSKALPIDATVFEGRSLAFQWNAEPEMDVWLTLGEHGLFPDPHRVRRQTIDAMGEAFQLRVGLMNEVGPRMELPPMYSSGSLARIEYGDGLIRLHLRDDVPGVMEYRVAVWERRQPLPRLIDAGVTEAHDGSITVLDIGIDEPLGWAISFDGRWRGARFAVEPGSATWFELQEKWCAVLESAPDWEATAKALCAWRFPVLMEPFLSVVQSRVQNAPVETLFAWTEQSTLEACMLMVEPAVYEAPLRQLLWDAVFDDAAVDACWDRHLQVLRERGLTAELYPPAERLLLANPVLLAKILGDGLLRRHREGVQLLPKVKDSLFGKIMKPDPMQVKKHRNEFRKHAQGVLVALKGAFGTEMNTSPDDLSALEREALSGLRSWCDNHPMDNHYFHKHVRDVADALYARRAADPKQLRLAIARSPLCSAYLGSFLFCQNVFRPLQKEEV